MQLVKGQKMIAIIFYDNGHYQSSMAQVMIQAK